jgi:hypothetical protein
MISGLLGAVISGRGKIMSYVAALTRAASAVALLVGVAALSLTSSATVANATLYSCPNTPLPSGDNRIYQVDSATGCQYGTGNLENVAGGGSQTLTYLGTQGTYPGSPATVNPTTLGTPIANFAGMTGTSAYVTLSGTINGTLTFNSAYNFTGVWIGLQDGNQTPQWAMFYLGSIAGGTVLNWDYLTCNTSNSACSSVSDFNLASSSLSGIEIWGAVSQNIVQTPLPAALPLFAAGIGLIGFAARKKRRTARLAA